METHEKCCMVDIPDCFNYFTKRREITDKKGGGLMVQLGKGIKYQILDSDSSDLLFFEVEVGNTKIKMVLVYMDVVSEERNLKIRRELNNIIERNVEESNLIVLGDFNGHVGFLGPQDVNRNGKYVLDIMEKFNLILLNGDDGCEGEITREENGRRSAIDFILINDRMYTKFIKMSIDEDKNIYSLSDHCLIELNIEIKVKVSNKIIDKEVVKYYDTRLERKDEFLNDFLNSVNGGSMEQESFDNMLKASADSVLKKMYTKKLKEDRKIEPIWFTKEIKDNIKLRQSYNRLNRNASNEDERIVYKALYSEQKIKTSKLVKESINEYEVKTAKKLKEQNNSKDLWKNINKLRRREEIKKDTQLYNEQNKLIEKHNVNDVIYSFWKAIYQPSENEIPKEWNAEKRREYIERLKEPTIVTEVTGLVPEVIYEEFRAIRPRYEGRVEENLSEMFVESPLHLREHMDMVGRVNMKEYIMKMPKVVISKEDVKEQIGRLKNGKQPGPDELKPEIYKWLGGNEQCLEMMAICMNKVLENCDPPIRWQKSRTSLIPKKQKPKPSELRPIALTDVSYKVFMGIMKKSLNGPPKRK